MSVFFTRRGKAERVNYVEYIESTGTQYIDTRFKPNNNTRVVLDFEPTAAYSSIAGIFGVRDTSSGTAAKMFVFWNNGANTFRTDYFGTQQTMTVSTLLARQTVDKDKNLTTIGSVSASNTASTGQCSNNLYLFCTNNAGTANYFAKLKLYSCQIYDNGTLIRDLRPCYDPDGVACLYDKVEKKYYYNAGTGEFYTEDRLPTQYYWQKHAVTYSPVYTREYERWQWTGTTHQYMRADLTPSIVNGNPVWVGSYMNVVDSYEAYPYIIGNRSSNISYGPVTLQYSTSTNSMVPMSDYVNTLTGVNKEKGSYISDVSSTDPNAYPENGVQDGYWYVKVN